MEVLITPVGEKLFDALRDPSVKIILMPGSSRSSKTYSIMQNIHLLMLERPNLRVTAWREKLTWARVSIMSDWERKFVIPSGYAKLYNSTKVPPVWTMKQTGSTLEFSGLDDPQKVHGVASDIVWINEAIEAEKATVQQLLQRLEGKAIFDYNPSEEEHWVYELEKRDDCVKIHSTYKDNPFLHDTVVKEIEAYEDTPFNRQQGTVSEYHWQVYGLGLPAKREGLIYPDWEIIDEWDQSARLLGYGLDFGFHPDPAALGRVGLLNGRLILDEMMYKTDLNNVIIKGREDLDSIQANLINLGIRRGTEIIADSAAKTSISELKAVGYRVEPVKKYPGSVIDGVNKMNNYAPFYVTSRSLNAIRELKNYIYLKDHNGLFVKDSLNKLVPIDNYNHLLDLFRYVVQTKLISTRGVSMPIAM